MVIITSAHTAHYIAVNEFDVEDWYWTRDHRSAYQFADMVVAEIFVSQHLASMKQDVWYLKG